MKRNSGPYAFLVSAAALARQFKETSSSLVKIKTAAGYLEFLKRLRVFLLGVFALVLLTVLLVAGLMTAEISLVFLFIESPKTQLIALASIGAGNALLAAAILACAFSSRQWLKFAAKTNKTVAKMTRNGRL